MTVRETEIRIDASLPVITEDPIAAYHPYLVIFFFLLIVILLGLIVLFRKKT
jgi:hypothetical protein